jgi:hypothetical protein
MYFAVFDGTNLANSILPMYLLNLKTSKIINIEYKIFLLFERKELTVNILKLFIKVKYFEQNE